MMNKLLITLIAAAFAGATMTAVAQAPGAQSDAPKATGAPAAKADTKAKSKAKSDAKPKKTKKAKKGKKPEAKEGAGDKK